MSARPGLSEYIADHGLDGSVPATPPATPKAKKKTKKAVCQWDWCKTEIAQKTTGRPRKFCSQACRQNSSRHNKSVRQAAADKARREAENTSWRLRKLAMLIGLDNGAFGLPFEGKTPIEALTADVEAMLKQWMSAEAYTNLQAELQAQTPWYLR